METKHNETDQTALTYIDTIANRLILPTLCSVVFILCYGVPFDGKNVLHTPNDMKGNYYLNSSKSSKGVSLYPKKKKRRFRLYHI